MCVLQAELDRISADDPDHGGASGGGFILEAAERRAEQVVAESNTTVVPSAFFDQLLDALDHSPEPNQATRKAAQKLEAFVSRQ